jgi:8-oxo-dGTP diphosphatase
VTDAPVVVAAGLLVDNGRVLVARRRDGDHLGGQWEFPGGKVQPGESIPAALARELREELGVRAEPGELWGTVRHRYPERDVRIHFLFARIIDGTPQAHAADEIRWASPPEMLELPFPHADRALVRELVRCHGAGIPLRDSRQTPPATGEDTP